jgi:glycosyltransferase involved in cell wall biosynthesis
MRSSNRDKPDDCQQIRLASFISHYPQRVELLRRPSIAIVTNLSSTYPPTHGAARRIWGLAKALTLHGFQVRVIESSTDSTVRQSQIGKTRVTSVPYPLTGPFRKTERSTGPVRAASPIWRMIRFGPQFNPKHTAYLTKLRSHSMLDIVQFEYPYPILEVLPLRSLGARLILDQHGVEVDFLHEILTSIGKSPVFLEPARVSLIERIAIQLASSVLCCSEHDRIRMLNRYGGQPSKFTVVENGVDEEFFRPVEPFRFPNPTVLFLGSFNHSPNLYAMNWIVEHVVPRVRRIIPEVRFAFVGSGYARLQDTEGVLVMRDVSDVRPFIRGATVALATVFHGSGSRLKILEYLACETPVVTTHKGMEGLNLEPDSEVLLADDPDSVARAIVELITNEPLATQLARAALSKIRTHYTWDAIIFKAISAYLRQV